MSANREARVSDLMVTEIISINGLASHIRRHGAHAPAQRQVAGR